MKMMSSLDVYAITKELQDLIGYRVENIYRDETNKIFLFKFKGKGKFNNPFLLIEPGVRIHLTNLKHPVPERPSDKTMALRGHLKGSELMSFKQIEFDRLIEMKMHGKQEYLIYIELFGNHPNFLVVDNKNRVIYALWYKKMRHRDVLPGKEFVLPPSRGKFVLDMNHDEFLKLFSEEGLKEEEIVSILARNTGGGGELMEELLTRAGIEKTTKVLEISLSDIEKIIQSIEEIKSNLENLKPNIILEPDEKPTSFHPFLFHSIQGNKMQFEDFSTALDYYYMEVAPKTTMKTSQQDKKKKKVEKVIKAQENAIKDFQRKKILYKKIGDLIYLHFDAIDELLNVVRQARKKNVDWKEIEEKLSEAKQKGIPSAQLLEEIKPEKAQILLKIDSEIIEVDFRKSTSELANGYYQLAKKAARKIEPAKQALKKTEKKLELLNEEIFEQKIAQSIILTRRKRRWFEKYHWTRSKSNLLVIGGKDISSNEEIVKRRMRKNDIFFHAEIHGAPYTILIRDSSGNSLSEDDYNTGALLAASFSRGWKAGYGAVDVYYVDADSVSFSAPSGEYIPKGGIMVRGNRKFIRGVELKLAIGVEINKSNATVIYGSEKVIRSKSKTTVLIKPGSISKGKLAKQIQKIFIEKADTLEEKAKIQGIDLNEFVHAIPNDSIIIDVQYGILNEDS